MNIIEIVVIFTIYRYLDMSIRSAHTWSSMPLSFCIFYICNVFKGRRSAMIMESHLHAHRSGRRGHDSMVVWFTTTCALRTGLSPFFQLSIYIFIFNQISFISLIFHLFFSYFNLFVSIFIQSYVNSNLQVSIIYILIIHKARNSETFKFVHLLVSVTFNAPYFHYIIQTIGHVSKAFLFVSLFVLCIR
jgi:hypothetical protein